MISKPLRILVLALSVQALLPAQAESLREELLLVPLTPALGGAATVERDDLLAFKQMVPNAGGMRFPQFMFGQRQFVSEWDPAPGQVPDPIR